MEKAYSFALCLDYSMWDMVINDESLVKFGVSDVRKVSLNCVM